MGESYPKQEERVQHEDRKREIGNAGNLHAVGYSFWSYFDGGPGMPNL